MRTPIRQRSAIGTPRFQVRAGTVCRAHVMSSTTLSSELLAALKRRKLGHIADTLPECFIVAEKQEMTFEELLLFDPSPGPMCLQMGGPMGLQSGRPGQRPVLRDSQKSGLRL